MELRLRRWVPWLLIVTVAFTRVHRAQSQLLDPSQAAVLEECQSEWKVRLSQWSNGGDCSKAEAIQCNEQGMITRMAPQGYVLQGSLPASIGNLVSLTYLDFYGARLNGTIPDTIGQLTALTHLLLWFNDLSGTIPYTVSALTNLKQLWLGMNKLSGSIPDELSALSALTWLDVGNNRLSGPVPDSLGLLSNLLQLNLGNNQLTGSIPPSLGHLSGLDSLNLVHNQFAGSLPAMLGQLTNLTRLYASALLPHIPCPPYLMDRVQCAAGGPWTGCSVQQGGHVRCLSCLSLASVLPAVASAPLAPTNQFLIPPLPLSLPPHSLPNRTTPPPPFPPLFSTLLSPSLLPTLSAASSLASPPCIPPASPPTSSPVSPLTPLPDIPPCISPAVTGPSNSPVSTTTTKAASARVSQPTCLLPYILLLLFISGLITI
ncbi:unnamed protein product [Closterium sp. Naga37s-1]|nr:unnamed protein product [Closterium sp. Naga37s-1]